MSQTLKRAFIKPVDDITEGCHLVYTLWTFLLFFLTRTTTIQLGPSRRHPGMFKYRKISWLNISHPQQLAHLSQSSSFFRGAEVWNTLKVVAVKCIQTTLHPLPVMAFNRQLTAALHPRASVRYSARHIRLSTSAPAGVPQSSFHYTCTICTCSCKQEKFPC